MLYKEKNVKTPKVKRRGRKRKGKEKKRKGEFYILTMKGRRIKRRVFIPS